MGKNDLWQMLKRYFLCAGILGTDHKMLSSDFGTDEICVMTAEQGQGGQGPPQSCTPNMYKHTLQY